MTRLGEMLRLNEHFKNRLDTLGITPIQGSVLLYLHRHPGLGMTAIANALGVIPFHLDLPLQKLAQKRLINSGNHPENGEVWGLTHKGIGLVPLISQETQELSTQIREVSLHPHHA